jgi:hypothetical protein
MNTISQPSPSPSTDAHVCIASGCPEIAAVLIKREAPASSPLCGEHWQAARVLADDPPSAVRVLPRTRCFVAACQTPAIEIVIHLDGTYLPCCETHLEDLSWVTPESSGRQSENV